MELQLITINMLLVFLFTILSLEHYFLLKTMREQKEREIYYTIRSQAESLGNLATYSSIEQKDVLEEDIKWSQSILKSDKHYILENYKVLQDILMNKIKKYLQEDEAGLYAFWKFMVVDKGIMSKEEAQKLSLDELITSYDKHIS